ncbi:monocyte to macrophage differentiation factor 2 isoform X4 [Saccopteryx bilineata]|uniref:monocyte to macrophage differentiation factor 2 isoform X4 n=1 Tax=Saccopteryx bilineata TaxID=59482 RepID=UPI00338DF185
MFAPRLLDFQKTKYARFMNHRVPAHKRYQPTEYEHAANCATHALWIIPSILGSSNLYFLSDDDWETISAWIYGLGLCGLFVVSTMFHTISWKKSHLRLNLRELGPWASHMRWLVWIMASVGTVYVFFFHERYKLVELLCYIIMGFFPALVILSMVVAQWIECRTGMQKDPGSRPRGRQLERGLIWLEQRAHQLRPKVAGSSKGLLSLLKARGQGTSQHGGHLGAGDRRGFLLPGNGVLQE